MRRLVNRADRVTGGLSASALKASEKRADAAAWFGAAWRMRKISFDTLALDLSRKSLESQDVRRSRVIIFYDGAALTDGAAG